MQGRSTVDLEKELACCTQLHSFLEENQMHMPQYSVSEFLGKHMNERSLSRSDVIAASGLNDIYAHQIFSGTRTPSRDKLFCLCFGLKLKAEEVQHLLRVCGYTPLYAKNRRDSIILFSFIKQLTLIDCNELLFEEKEALLG